MAKSVVAPISEGMLSAPHKAVRIEEILRIAQAKGFRTWLTPMGAAKEPGEPVRMFGRSVPWKKIEVGKIEVADPDRWAKAAGIPVDLARRILGGLAKALHLIDSSFATVNTFASSSILK